MKKIIYIIIITTVFVTACKKDFLEKKPYGELTSEQVESAKNVEHLIISAYSILNGQGNQASNAFNSPASNWSFGDVTSDDAYKGGGGIGDQNQINRMEIFATDPQIIDVEQKFAVLFEGVGRANTALIAINKSDMDPDLKKKRIAEMRFLRGHFYFELKKIYNRIPYIDETGKYLSNQQITPTEVWAKIENDFIAAEADLPDVQTELGRPTKWAAEAYLCKTYLYQQKWDKANAAADLVILNGGYSLLPNFSDTFLPENDNGPDVIFAVQNSINDGSPKNYNGSIGDRLMPPGGPRYPKYGFERPSQNLVNSFKTDSNGLPQEDNIDITDSTTVDPRLDVTVGRPGIPYKDLGILYEESWERDVATYGPYAPKKRVISANDPNYLPTWPYVTAANTLIIRYADVLLWKAEASIELGNLEDGRKYINMVRNRAKTSKYIKNLDGTADAGNYLIDTYNTPFTDYNEAITALRNERRAEFALEGQRFFDLVRWNIAGKVLNNYFEKEKIARGYLVSAKFVTGKNEYMPIPQSEIDAGPHNSDPKSANTQNPGY